MAHKLGVVLDAYHEQLGLEIVSPDEALAFVSIHYTREKERKGEKRKRPFDIHYVNGNENRPFLNCLVNGLYLDQILTGQQEVLIPEQDPGLLSLDRLWLLRYAAIKIPSSDPVLKQVRHSVSNGKKNYGLDNWGKHITFVGKQKKVQTYFGKTIKYSSDVLKCRAPENIIAPKKGRGRSKKKRADKKKGISCPSPRKRSPKKPNPRVSEKELGLTDSTWERAVGQYQ